MNNLKISDWNTESYARRVTSWVKMRDLEIPHEYRVRNGGYHWGYWRTSLRDGLIFISEKFHL